MRRTLLAFLPTLGTLALLGIARPATAGVATFHRLSFQGVARDASNLPVASGNVRVRVYSAPTGGALVYDSNSEFNGAIVGGVFNVLLGGGAPLTLDDTQLYHLELDVNGAEVVGDAASGRQAFWPSGGDLSRPDYDGRLQALENAVFASCGPGEFNLNGNPADGCEFVLDNNAIYVDGGDPGANDNAGCGLGPVGTGVNCRPCLTIARGLVEASATGRTKVNVANGSYSEGVLLVGGKSLFGGWRSLTWTRDVAHTATVIRGETTSGNHKRAIAGSGITTPTTIDGFVVYGPVATAAGGNSYGVYLTNCGGVSFTNNVIFAGVGGPGTDGSVNSNGADGVAGTAGGNAIQSTNSSCNVALNRTGGPGGVLFCSGTNVSGGAGGGNQCTPIPNSEFSGIDGTAGTGGGGAGGDAGDDGAVSGAICTTPPSPVNGAAGSNGTSGTNGVAGAGASNAIGSVSTGQWLGTGGGNATGGGLGRGGGGGGAGGGSDASIAPDKDVLGGAGGGGGSGGCGGVAGTGGAAGGGSFGLFIVSGSAPVITGNVITRGYGGVGGRGGSGGRGGLGGLGGVGGSALF
ncbi:MAG: hypothetical protein ABIU54_00975, partial [Candidatus Eisenbacteria bacterium]